MPISVSALGRYQLFVQVYQVNICVSRECVLNKSYMNNNLQGGYEYIKQLACMMRTQERAK